MIIVHLCIVKLLMLLSKTHVLAPVQDRVLDVMKKPQTQSFEKCACTKEELHRVQGKKLKLLLSI